MHSGGTHEAQTYAKRSTANVIHKGTLSASKSPVNGTGVNNGVCREPYPPPEKAVRTETDCIWEEICEFGKQESGMSTELRQNKTN